MGTALYNRHSRLYSKKLIRQETLPCRCSIIETVSLNGVGVHSDGHALDCFKLIIVDLAGNGNAVKERIQGNIFLKGGNSILIPELISTGVVRGIIRLALIDPVGAVIAVKDAQQVCFWGSKMASSSAALLTVTVIRM